MVTYVLSREFHERLWEESEPRYSRRFAQAVCCNLEVEILGLHSGHIVYVPNSCQLPTSGNVRFTRNLLGMALLPF